MAPSFACTAIMGAGTAPAPSRTLVFTYGTLKRGFFNHWLMQEMISTGDAVFLGEYRTMEAYPLVCGPYQVPFLLNMPGAGYRIRGELYGATELGIRRMDELEGTSKGHYERLPVLVRADRAEEGEEVVGAEAYFGHRSYAEGLWNRNGQKGLCVYSEEEARNYVKRNDRPEGTTFLDQIRMFVDASQISE